MLNSTSVLKQIERFINIIQEKDDNKSWPDTIDQYLTSTSKSIKEIIPAHWNDVTITHQVVVWNPPKTESLFGRPLSCVYLLYNKNTPENPISFWETLAGEYIPYQLDHIEKLTQHGLYKKTTLELVSWKSVKNYFEKGPETMETDIITLEGSTMKFSITCERPKNTTDLFQTLKINFVFIHEHRVKKLIRNAIISGLHEYNPTTNCTKLCLPETQHTNAQCDSADFV